LQFTLGAVPILEAKNGVGRLRQPEARRPARSVELWRKRHTCPPR
jgi:hypothetical protein